MASEVKPGQVRRFTLEGHEALGLIFRDWMDGDIWLVCPIKDTDEEGDPTGLSLFAQPDRETFFQSIFRKDRFTGGYAMPALGGTVDVERIKKMPIVGDTLQGTAEACWNLWRWAATGKDKPNPEDFHYFENKHSESDWEKSYIVLGPLDPDDGWVLPDEPPNEEEEESDDEAFAFNARDDWGECCSDCKWWGQPHKPCAACQGAAG